MKQQSETARGTGTRSRARRGEGDRLRADLLDVAEQVLLEKRDAASVSVREIARRAGCSPPAIYLHFSGKDELLLETCARRWEQFAAAVMSGLDDASSVVDRLRRVARAYMTFGVENPGQYQVLFAVRPPRSEEVAEREAPSDIALLVAVVAEGMESGELLHGDPVSVALGLWASVHGMVMLLLSIPDYQHPTLRVPDRDALFDSVIDMWMRGVVAP